MGDDPDTSGQQSRESASTDELRTIGFRLREIQRLLAMRVEQENRRLEAGGAEPVTEANRFAAAEAAE
jgi:hypothetical protein